MAVRDVLYILSILLILAFFLTLFWRYLVFWIRRNREVSQEERIRVRDATTESPLEQKLAQALDAKGIKYHREYLIGRTHVDFAFPASKLVVECDGYRYHSSKDQRAHDAKRDAFLKTKGWTVLRFNGDDIHSNLHACIRKISGLL